MADNSSLPRDLATEIGVEDLYEFLGVSSASTDKEVIYLFCFAKIVPNLCY